MVGAVERVTRVTGISRRSGWRRVAAVGAAVTVALGLVGCSDDLDAMPSDDEPATARSVEASGPILDDIVTDVMAASEVPGVAVAVVHDGRVVIAEGYGVRETGTDDAVDAETVFQVASLSKPISSTVVAGAVGRGDVAWDQPVVELLPEFELSDDYVTDHVTIADLYSHRSGLPGETAGNDLEQLGYERTEIVERLRYLPLAPFRSTYSYSNFGLTVGAVAAAAGYGTSFEQMADEVLFEPAGMTSTSFRHDDFITETNAAKLHVRIDETYRARFTRDADAQAPAGGASSNVVDLARWMILQLDEGRLDGEQIIDAASLAASKRPFIRTDFESDPVELAAQSGLGWGVGTASADASLVEWSHSGAFSAGAGTAVRLVPALDLGIVVLTNAFVGAAEAIADGYLDTVVNGQASIDWFADGWGPLFAGILVPPVHTPPATITAARDVSAYVGTYANDYLGEVAVRETPTGLEIAAGPGLVTVIAVEHFDADTFVGTTAPEIEGARSLFVFEFDGGAERATRLLFEAGDDVAPWAVLTRAD
jgi:CubicO group peptidase (beta-lactamase class C family)